jgi:hypothetical protein
MFTFVGFMPVSIGFVVVLACRKVLERTFATTRAFLGKDGALGRPRRVQRRNLDVA